MRIPLLVLALAIPTVAVGQEATQPLTATPEMLGFSSDRLARIDSLLNELVTQQKIPGAVVLILREGSVVKHTAYGFRDVGTRVPLQKDDIFRIASQSKAITSLAVMMLWEEGRFGLDDPISRYIPEFAKPSVLTSFNPKDSSYTAEPAGREITIRQLLTHTSGLDYPGIGSEQLRAIYAKAGVPSGIGTNGATIGEKMKILARLPLKAKPGQEFTYSLSLDVLGYFVEVISGTPFDRFLRTRIFDPLGMDDSWFYLPPEKAARLVTLHDGKNGTVEPVMGTVFDGVDPDYPARSGSYFSGGAGLSGSIEDYARFLQFFLNKGELNGVRLLSSKTVELMMAEQIPTLPVEHGLGFGLETPANDYRSPKTVGSFSWGGAFNTTYWADPAEHLVALLYTNQYNPAVPALGDRFTTMTYAAIVR
ncbi:MAG: serine hydrolase domain-containing protein [Gemmatimonadota bacterium]